MEPEHVRDWDRKPCTSSVHARPSSCCCKCTSLLFMHVQCSCTSLMSEEENGMGDGEQFGGEEEEMGGEPRSKEREESGVCKLDQCSTAQQCTKALS